MTELSTSGKLINSDFIFRAVTVEIVTDIRYADLYKYVFESCFSHIWWVVIGVVWEPGGLPPWVMKLPVEPESAGNAEMLRAACGHIKRLVDNHSILLFSKHMTVFEKLLELFLRSGQHTLTYLVQDANTLVAARAETTASIPEVGLSRILQNKEIHDRLYAELEEAVLNVSKVRDPKEVAVFGRVSMHYM
ncbi:hypothetical protein F4823DRAFT_562648 [Ustulina deusta]|nr:hypothetical protein F4823DRAFT_562648 [Ustulina deusta]